MTTFPNPSETFAVRELQALARLGWRIGVLAAQAGKGAWQGDVAYRPARWSLAAARSMAYMIRRYPLGLLRLGGLVLRLLRQEPREGVSLLANVHTVAHFVRCGDAWGVRHVHAYFLNWPACMAMAVGCVTGWTMSLACHARDVFVEAGAVRLKAEQARFISACNDDALGRLKTLLPMELHGKLHRNHHGVSWGERPGDGERSAQSPATVLAVARLEPKKGLEHLLRAVAAVVRKGVACRLVIAGDGSLRQQLATLAERLGLASCVTFAGWQDPAGVGRLLRSATVLAVPSIVAADGDRDGIPNVILEAFAAGVPVAATRLAGISEAIKHGRTGVLVGPGDEDELAGAIEMLLADEALRRRLAEAAWEAGCARFDLCTNVRGISQLLKEACAC